MSDRPASPHGDEVRDGDDLSDRPASPHGDEVRDGDDLSDRPASPHRDGVRDGGGASDGDARPGGILDWHAPDLPEEPAAGPDYSDPVDHLEREAAGLPPLESRERPAGPPPREVTLSVVLWLAAAAATALAFILMIVDVDEIAAANVAAYERAIRAGDPIMRTDITAEDVEAGASGLAWLLGSGGVMLAILVVTFAYRVREGTRSARTVLSALTLVIAAFCAFLPVEYVNLAHWIGLALSVVAAVLLFLPAASAYLPKLPVAKRRWRGGQ
jgi:hypothetical protein